MKVLDNWKIYLIKFLPLKQNQTLITLRRYIMITISREILRLMINLMIMIVYIRLRLLMIKQQLVLAKNKKRLVYQYFQFKI